MNTLKSWFAIAKGYALAHKVIATIIALVVLYALYYTYGVITAPSTATRYVTTTIATGTVVASLTETGQVSASSNIDIQSKSSGAVLSIPVAAGQHVARGAALTILDATAARQAVRSAEQSLQSAQISLAKLQEPATLSTLTSSKNALASAQANLIQIHQNGYNDISTAFLNLPTVITGLDGVLHGFTVPGHSYQQNADTYSSMVSQYDASITQYQSVAESSYQTALVSYTKALADFKATSRTADDATIEVLIIESYHAATDLSDALKASSNFLNLVNTDLSSRNFSIPSTLPTQISTLTSYTTLINGHVATLASDTASVTSDERALAAAQASLDQLQAGTDPLDLQSSQLSVQMKEDALAQAQQSLADTVVRAPFSGTVAKLNVQQYQTIGSGTAVATLVSDNQSVNISVNEVDAAKIKVGEKTTITFDALPTISIAGTVSSVNTIGTVSSGVVSYSAVITFDTPNPSVKPGMSATTDIIIGTETGLVLPSSAVKSTSGQSYVEIFNPPLPAGAVAQAGASGISSTVAPTRTNVTTGLSSDMDIIVTSGLSEGMQVVTRTIAGTAVTASSAAQSTSIFGIGGSSLRTGGGSGAVRTGSGTTRPPGQ